MTPGSQIQFEWDVDYGFVWGNTGEVIPGVTFTASGQLPADPQSRNTTTFSTAPGPNLSPAMQAPPPGSLVINDASNVPNNRFAVGISMSGAGTFVTEAGPNLIHTFTPTPTYWIAAGRNVQVGTVLGITTVNQSLQVTFPPNIRELTYILNTNNQWVPR
jgi:rhizosphere induced protein